MVKKEKILLFVILLLCFYLLYILLKFTQTEKEKKYNVILITIESLRADHLPCYGYKRDTAPNICSLAEGGVLFENAYSQGSHMRMSIPSLLTSLPPSSVGLENWTFSIPDNIETFPEILKRENYMTITNQKKSNFQKGFTKIINISDFEFPKNKFLVWFSFEENPHFPYAPTQEYRIWDNVSLNQTQLSLPNTQKELLKKINVQDLIDLYDEEILEVDYEIKNFILKLKTENIYNNSMIIITADHGEAFGEHGHFGYGGQPFEELIHIPLIIKFPENGYADKRVGQPVRLIDIGPTIYDVLNLKETPEIFGTSLISAIKDKDLNLIIFSAGSPGNEA